MNIIRTLFSEHTFQVERVFEKWVVTFLFCDALLIAYHHSDTLHLFTFEKISHRAILLLVDVDVHAWDVVNMLPISHILEYYLFD